jgi:RimJ/RimL family protein N-acetyltransferase
MNAPVAPTSVADPTDTDAPVLRKARLVHGRTLVMRDAVPADAAFILAARTDPQIGRHLSATSCNLQDQTAWLERYARRDDEAYFVIGSTAERGSVRLGTVRLYGARGDAFCWGSWILMPEAPPDAAIQSTLMVYAYALDHLGFDCSYFQVNHGNDAVWRFHEHFGARLVATDATQRHYELSRTAIRASMTRYRKYLPDGVRVEH